MITPMDIHNKTFSRQIRGYSQEEVNAFLEELASDYERIYREHRDMEDEMDTLKTKLRNYEKMEATMSSTLVMAQKTAESVKSTAQKEAELSIREAHNEAKKIVANAEAQRRQVNSNLLKTEGDMNLYIEKLLANFKAAMNLIEQARAVKAPTAVKAASGDDIPKAPPVDDQSGNLFRADDNPAAAEEPQAEEAQPAEGAAAPQPEAEAQAEGEAAAGAETPQDTGDAPAEEAGRPDPQLAEEVKADMEKEEEDK